MNVKTFLQNSLKSDNKDLCKGWEYLKENITDELKNIISQSDYWEMVYNSEKVDYITSKLDLNLTEEEKKQLGSFVYIQNKIKRKSEEEEYKIKMLKEGWNLLNEEIVKKAFIEKKKLQIKSEQTSDWIKIKCDNIYNPFVRLDGKCFLMKPKARTKGHHLCQFENAFCKII